MVALGGLTGAGVESEPRRVESGELGPKRLLGHREAAHVDGGNCQRLDLIAGDVDGEQVLNHLVAERANPVNRDVAWAEAAEQGVVVGQRVNDGKRLVRPRSVLENLVRPRQDVVLLALGLGTTIDGEASDMFACNGTTLSNVSASLAATRLLSFSSGSLGRLRHLRLDDRRRDCAITTSHQLYACRYATLSVTSHAHYDIKMDSDL
jgi:hypothetical protein